MADPPPKQKSYRTFVHFIPILLMVLIGIIQISVSWGLGLIVPDKGGGFGMFSHIDGAYTRYAYVVLITDQGTMGELVTAESKKQLWLLKCMKNNPTEARMVNMARILGLRWQNQRDSDLNKQKQAKNPAQVKVLPEFKQIRLEICGPGFSSDTQTATLKTLKAITINWPGGKLLNTRIPPTKPVSP